MGRFSLEDLHSDNLYLDTAIELSPLGDLRDIVEGYQRRDFHQGLQGALGLAGTVLGAGALVKGYKAYKGIQKLKKLKTIQDAYKTTNGLDPKTAARIIQRSKDVYSNNKKAITAASKAVAVGTADKYYDAKSINERFNNPEAVAKHNEYQRKNLSRLRQKK